MNVSPLQPPVDNDVRLSCRLRWWSSPGRGPTPSASRGACVVFTASPEAEARVVSALTLGETVEQIAVAHGVRVSTVRAQVRSIFEKTGVHRQTDLVRLALSAAPSSSSQTG